MGKTPEICKLTHRDDENMTYPGLKLAGLMDKDGARSRSVTALQSHKDGPA